MILAFETSTATGGVALLETDGPGGPPKRLLGSAHYTSPTLHGQRLLPSVEWLLARTGRTLADVTAVAVARGPGSFTGLRIGLAAAKALAHTRGVPLLGIDTLAALAARVAWGGVPPGAWICPMLDARQGEVYAALHRAAPAGTPHAPWLPEPPRHGAGHAGTLEAWADRVAELTSAADDGDAGPVTFAGEGLTRLEPRLREVFGPRFAAAPALRAQPTAEEIAALAAARLARGERDDPHTLVPDYWSRGGR